MRPRILQHHPSLRPLLQLQVLLQARSSCLPLVIKPATLGTLDTTSASLCIIWLSDCINNLVLFAGLVPIVILCELITAFK